MIRILILKTALLALISASCSSSQKTDYPDDADIRRLVTKPGLHLSVRDVRLIMDWTYLDGGYDVQNFVGDEINLDFYVDKGSRTRSVNVTHLPKIGSLPRLKKLSISSSPEVWLQIRDAGGFAGVEHVKAYCHTRSSQAVFDWLGTLPNLKTVQVAMPNYDGMSAVPLAVLDGPLDLWVQPRYGIPEERADEIAPDFVGTLRELGNLSALQIDGVLTEVGQENLVETLESERLNHLKLAGRISSLNLAASILFSSVPRRVDVNLDDGVCAALATRDSVDSAPSRVYRCAVSIDRDEFDSLLDIIRHMENLVELEVSLRGDAHERLKTYHLRAVAKKQE